MGLLDVVLQYACNLACDYCTMSPELRARTLPSEAVLRELRRGRAEGYDRVSFTGGEPTLRRELPQFVRAARDLGFRERRIHTNGLLLAHPPNLDRLVAAGATEFQVSVRTHLPDAFDRMVRRPGAHALLGAALDALVRRPGLHLRAELIVTAETYPRLPDAVRWLAARGVPAVDVGYVSLTGANAGNVASLPRMSDAAPVMREAFAVARAAGLDARSLHVPRCLLGEDAGHAHDPGAGRVKVVTPDAVFALEESKLFGRAWAAGCGGCAHRAVCPGLRPDYVARFGDAEFVAVPAGAAAPLQGGSGTSSSS